VFVLGDNFYSSGLHPTPADPKSEARIKKTYEDVYTAPSLITIPFWVCAGNHDHLGNVTNQIEYSTSPQNLNIASSTTKGATISAGKRCTKSVATPLQPLFLTRWVMAGELVPKATPRQRRARHRRR